MATDPYQEFATIVPLIAADEAKLNAWINGGENETVMTDSGPIPTWAGLRKELVTNIGEEASGLLVISTDGQSRTLGDWVGGVEYTFPTVADMQSDTRVVVGSIVMARGATSAGDGGGNLYAIVPGGTGVHDGGEYIDLPATGLQAMGLFPGKSTTRLQWGESGTDEQAEKKSQEFVDKIFAPVYHPRRGLRISEFLDTDDVFTVQTDEVQEAVNACLESSRYNGIDFEELRIAIDAPIEVDTDKFGFFQSPKVFKNVQMFVADSWSGLDSDPAFNILDSSGSTRAEYLKFINFNLNLRGLSDGFHIQDDYFNIDFEDMQIRAPANIGIRDGNNGHDLRLSGVKVFGGESSIPFANRKVTAIKIQSADAQVNDCLVTYCKHSLDLRGASSLAVIGTHVYQGDESLAVPTAGHQPAVILGSGNPVIRFVGCYIDNGYVLVDANGAPATRNITFRDTLFTVKDAVESYNFIVVDTDVPNLPMTDWTISGCTFRALDSEFVTNPFTRVGTGNIDVNNAINTEIDHNQFSNVSAQGTRPAKRINLDGSQTYGFDFTGNTAFNLNVNSLESVSVYSVTNVPSPVPYTARRTGAKTGNVLFADTSIASGSLIVTARCDLP